MLRASGEDQGRAGWSTKDIQMFYLSCVWQILLMSTSLLLPGYVGKLILPERST